MNNNYNPAPAKTFASVVYVGVVVAVTTLFISFILTAFPPDAYLSRIVMVIAGLLIGASSIAFPIALHTWTIEKTHRGWTTAFYYGEIGIMAVNTVVSFMTLLGQRTGYVVPEWALLYEPFSVGAIVYTLFAWGTVFLMDPEHKRTQQSRQLKDDFEKEVANKRMEFVRSIEGENAIAGAAASDIQTMLMEQRNGKKHFGTPVPSPIHDVAVDPQRGFVPRVPPMQTTVKNVEPRVGWDFATERNAGLGEYHAKQGVGLSPMAQMRADIPEGFVMLETPNNWGEVCKIGQQIPTVDDVGNRIIATVRADGQLDIVKHVEADWNTEVKPPAAADFRSPQ